MTQAKKNRGERRIDMKLPEKPWLKSHCYSISDPMGEGWHVAWTPEVLLRAKIDWLIEAIEAIANDTSQEE